MVPLHGECSFVFISSAEAASNPVMQITVAVATTSSRYPLRRLEFFNGKLQGRALEFFSQANLICEKFWWVDVDVWSFFSQANLICEKFGDLMLMLMLDFAPGACSCLNKKVTLHFCCKKVLTTVLSDNHRWVLMLIDTDPFVLEGKRYQVYHWDFTITTKPSMQIIPLSSEWHPETSTEICQKKLQNTSLVGFVMKRNCYCLYYACFILRLVIQIVAIIAIMGQIKH